MGILYGEQDAILSPDAHMSYIATSLPNSMAEIIPNAGHMIINTQPEACFNFINKVNKLDAQGELA